MKQLLTATAILFTTCVVFAVVYWGTTQLLQPTELLQPPLVSCHDWEVTETLLTDAGAFQRKIPLTKHFDLDFHHATPFIKDELETNLPIATTSAAAAYDSFMWTSTQSLKRSITETVALNEHIFERKVPATFSAVLPELSSEFVDVTASDKLPQPSAPILSMATVWQDVPKLWLLSVIRTEAGFFTKNATWDTQRNAWVGEWQENSTLTAALGEPTALSILKHPAASTLLIFATDATNAQTFSIPVNDRQPIWDELALVTNNTNTHDSALPADVSIVHASDMRIFCHQTEAAFSAAQAVLEGSRQTFSVTQDSSGEILVAPEKSSE